MASRVNLNDFASMAMREYGTLVLKRKQLQALREKYDVLIPRPVWFAKAGRGLFRIDGSPDPTSPTAVESAPAQEKSVEAPEPVVVNTTEALAFESFNGIKVFSTSLDHSLVPNKDNDFVAWGNYHLIKKLLSTDQFLSIYVKGETGNGKTMNFEQAAAALGRELVTVNFTAQTDEDDLVGGFRLVGGDTVWVDGPVLEAMKRGAILLLDEVDLSTEPVMALQPVLQGKPYFVKKLGRLITPAKGFMVVATANTKGDGDGDYVFTNVMNKAFLDRFKIMVEQEYPPIAVERKILAKYVKNNCPHVTEQWINNITKFVDVVRNTYREGGLAEQISTRRLVDMTMMYGLLGNAAEAIKLATNRFDADTQKAMLYLWENIDTNPEPLPVAMSTDDVAEDEFVGVAQAAAVAQTIPQASTNTNSKIDNLPF